MVRPIRMWNQIKVIIKCQLGGTGLPIGYMSSHTDAIHIGAMEIDGSRMTLPRQLSVEMGAIHIRRY